MSEAVTEADLQAYADGTLPEERRAAVATWLAAHPEDAERIDSYRRIAEELRTSYDGVLHEPVPERLQRAVQRPRTRAFALVAGAVLLGVALGGLGGWQLRGIQGTPSTPGDGAGALARRAAVAHATYSKLEAVGYSLVGGRLLPGENGPVAHFMYQCNRGTRVTLYVRSDMGSNRSTAFRYAREANVGVFYWVDTKIGYAVSSADISKEDLLNVANAAYQQLNPP